MIDFRSSLREDYNHHVNVGGKSVLCYNPKKMKELFPQGQIPLAGELPAKKPKKPKAAPDTANTAEIRAEGEGKKTKAIGKIVIGETDTHDVLSAHTCNPLLYKKAGYVAVGNDEYLCLLTSRIPFFSMLLAAVLAFAAALTLIFMLSGNRPAPVHPLPDKDPNSHPIQDPEEGGDEGGNNKFESSETGGGVSLVYQGHARVYLKQNQVQFYYNNPERSNQSVVIEIYVLDGEKEYLIGKTGRVEPGHGIRQTDLITTEAMLSPTRDKLYDALFRLTFYDEVTGVRAYVTTDITDILITVYD